MSGGVATGTTGMAGAMRMDRRRWMCGLAAQGALLGLGGCGPRPPIRIGFLGGLSNQASSFSKEGRNGAILAVEQRNLAGGIGGYRIDLVVQDYGEGPGRALAALRALLDAGVTATIGPYSSAAASELEPVAEERQALLLSPISRDDVASQPGGHLLRIGRVRRHEAQAVAGMLLARGLHRVAMASDRRSAAYASAWTADFRQAFMAQGGTWVDEVAYGVDAEPSFQDIARQLLAKRPEGVLFVTGSADAARLAQQVARLAPGLPMTASGRAINDALVELGGKAVEGMVLVQPYDAGDSSPRYLAFRDAYQARFGNVPTYSAMVSFDAVTILAEAFARRAPDETPRDAVLRHGPYQGLQETIRFGPGGETPPRVWFSVVRDGRFEPVR